jgi:hypothetical protein
LVATGAAATLWNPIDADFITRADNAGWDETMLLPHQTELSLVVNASVLATFFLVVTAFHGLLATRRRAGVTTQRQAQGNRDARRIDGE